MWEDVWIEINQCQYAMPNSRVNGCRSRVGKVRHIKVQLSASRVVASTSARSLPPRPSVTPRNAPSPSDVPPPRSTLQASPLTLLPAAGLSLVDSVCDVAHSIPRTYVEKGGQRFPSAKSRIGLQIHYALHITWLFQLTRAWIIDDINLRARPQCATSSRHHGFTTKC